MNKNKLLIVLLGCVFGQWALAAGQTQSRALTDFSAINLNLSGDVVYHPGAPRLKITAPADVLARISSEVNHGELQLILRGQGDSREKIHIEISSPTLRAAVISGSGDLVAKNLNADELALVLVGSGDVAASGKVRQLSIQVSGSGDVNAARLAASRLSVDVFGSGDVKARAADYAHIHVMGTGDVTVEGSPAERVLEAHGSGKISFGR